MVRGKPKIEEVLPDFLRFAKGSILVAYNAKFDIGFLRVALCEKASILDEFEVLDVLALARFCFPGFYSYRLGDVACGLGIPIREAHRAMADVQATWQIFKRELATFESLGFESFDEVCQLLSRRRRGRGGASKKTLRSQIQAAIDRKETIQIKYFSGWNQEITSRKVLPIEIEGPHVHAFCHLRNAERHFRLDSILKIDKDTHIVKSKGKA